MSAPRSRFDLSDPVVAVRILCGLLFVPHILFKLKGMDGAAAYFAKAGFDPAYPFLILAIIAESISALGLVFNVATKWTGLLAAAVMAGASKAVLTTKGAVWLWNLGGIEYNVVWCLLCLIIAIHAWREEYKTYGRVYFLFPKAVDA